MLARLFRLASPRYALSVYGLAMSLSKLEEEASAIVITSDDTWVALIKFLLQKEKFAGSLQESLYEFLVQMMLMKHSPLLLISQIRMLTKSGLLMHRLFSLPNKSGGMISCGPCQGC